MKYTTIAFICSFLILCACGENSSESSSNEKSNSTVPATSSNAESLPSIPVPLMQKLFEKCNHVDYLFYQSNFSMSMDNKGSIQSTLTHVSQNVPTLDKPCKPIGRIFYEIDGNTEIEAEIFFSNECQHFIFMKDNKKLYANNITPDGVAHFKNIFKQAAGMAK